MFADIGTNAAFGAVTASVSCSSTLGMALNALEATGGAVDVGQAVGDMAQNGLTVGNGTQLASGLLSIASGTIFKNCFPAGTPVSTEHGHKPIEDIQPGDRVWAYSLSQGQWLLRPVLETYEFVNDAFVDLWVEEEEEKLTSTAHHPFWVIRGEDLESRPRPDHISAAEQELVASRPNVQGRWVDAGDLRVGDVLLLMGSKPSRVMGIEKREKTQTVFNFAVDELECYAVGNSHVLVHNTNGPEAAQNAPGAGNPQAQGWGNIGGHGPVSTNTVLDGAIQWLGPGYREIAPGVFRSANGLRQFRMTTRDLLPTHGNIGPHVHFEFLNAAGQVIENLHIPIVP